jgi:hypothetical protein
MKRDTRWPRGAYGLFRSRSMRLSSFSCIDKSAMRFSCAFTFCSRAALDDDAAGRGAVTVPPPAGGTAQGGAVEQPPLNRTPAISPTTTLRDQPLIPTPSDCRAPVLRSSLWIAASLRQETAALEGVGRRVIAARSPILRVSCVSDRTLFHRTWAAISCSFNAHRSSMASR